MSDRKIPPPAPARTTGGGKKTDKTDKESDFVYKNFSVCAMVLAEWLTHTIKKGDTTRRVDN